MKPSPACLPLVLPEVPVGNQSPIFSLISSNDFLKASSFEKEDTPVFLRLTHLVLMTELTDTRPRLHAFWACFLIYG
jgi:hypothetical protein